MNLVSYARELNFAVRSVNDWKSLASLITATAQFHLNNSIKTVKRTRPPIDIDLRIGPMRRTVRLRPCTGDFFIFYEVLAFHAYALPEDLLAPAQVRTIVDCGANIGMTALYMAGRYPHARIIAVEADPQNFAILTHNTAGIDRILPVHGALVGTPRASVRFGTNRPSWGNSIVTDTDATASVEVPAMTMDDLIARCGIDQIDLLKVDIEGGEADLFSRPQFLARVGLVAIELHGAYGLNQFRAAISGTGFRVYPSGELDGVRIMTARPAG